MHEGPRHARTAPAPAAPAQSAGPEKQAAPAPAKPAGKTTPDVGKAEDAPEAGTPTDSAPNTAGASGATTATSSPAASGTAAPGTAASGTTATPATATSGTAAPGTTATPGTESTAVGAAPAGGTTPAETTKAPAPAGEATAVPAAAATEPAVPGKPATPTGKNDDLTATKADLPPVGADKPAEGEPAVKAAYGLARLTRRRLRPPGTARHAAVPLNPVLRRFPAVHGMAQRSFDGAAAWRRGRWGRLTLPGLLLLGLLGAAGATGGLLVPAVAGTRAAPQASPGTEPAPGAIDPTAAAPGPEFPVPPLVTGLPEFPIDPTAGATPTAPAAGARPADALASWAQGVSTKSGIPLTAMQAYGYAEWVVGQRQPNCHLTWTTLAAIGKVESNHGRANGATLMPDGQSSPPIQGLPLDGKGDRKLIPDTDQGRLDGDSTYDRAVGSMQFIPTTWAIWKVDADNDGVTDPNDIDDAALAAGNYLCANGKDLSTTEDWWNAILTYNNVEPYAQSVYEAANDFGVRSRT
ncbi:lytic transglycosylase domain-containing protein [Catenuloplanes japonicus]|uniref:lytic transglycosylase domain-containing protein n=1 Tax=Catenuloplanes japonicus TaxID=33876 RepID=UPI000689436C|nr:lytic murein transglycosylase [Catenuloplanes japonicus]